MVCRDPGYLSVYPATSIGVIDRRPMSEDLMYRRIEISGLGGTLPEKVGSFVVGIPRRIIEDLRTRIRRIQMTQFSELSFRHPNTTKWETGSKSSRILQPWTTVPVHWDG